MGYKTPNEFLEVYYKHLLEKAEIEAIAAEKRRIEAKNKAGLVGADWYGQSLYFDTDRDWRLVDRCKSNLNHFLEGELDIPLSLQLWARFATVSFSNIDIKDPVPDFFEKGMGLHSLLKWFKWWGMSVAKGNCDVQMNLTDAGRVVIKSMQGHVGKRSKVIRHGYYYSDTGWDDDEEMAIYLEPFKGLVRALIAAYDVGIWGAIDESIRV